MYRFRANINNIAICRMNLVEEEIESSVSKMQTVIELGRIIRDRKTIPIKVRCYVPFADSAF